MFQLFFISSNVSKTHYVMWLKTIDKSTLLFISVRNQSFTHNTKLSKTLSTRQTTQESVAILHILSSKRKLSLQDIARRVGRSPATVLPVLRNVKFQKQKYIFETRQAWKVNGRTADFFSVSGPRINKVNEEEFYCQAHYERGKRWVGLFTASSGDDLSSPVFSRLYIV